MPVLVLLNGAPGVGKSTVAAALASRHPMTLALDVDVVKHALGCWSDDPVTSGVQARRLALAMAATHLADGYDVVVAQYAARIELAEQFEGVAADRCCRFVEVLLSLPPADLAARLDERRHRPTRPAVAGRVSRPRWRGPVCSSGRTSRGRGRWPATPSTCRETPMLLVRTCGASARVRSS